MTKKTIIFNSTLLFVIATVLQQTLHEIAHFIAAIYFHSNEISLHHNYVQHDSSLISLNARIIIASAGPLFSLIIGICFYLICAAYSKRNLFFLFSLYMSAFGCINFGGYILVSPFFKSGDTGYVFKQLEFPFWLNISLAIGGAIFLIFSMKILSKYFIEMANEEIIYDESKRREFISSIVKFPILFGIIITAILNLPAVSPLSLIYPVFSPFTMFWVYGNYLNPPRQNTIFNKAMGRLNKFSLTLSIIFLLTIIYNRLLVNGLDWNL